MVTYQSSNTVTIQPWNFLIFITADTYTLNNPARVVNFTRYAINYENRL